jgi:UrcA family protein
MQEETNMRLSGLTLISLGVLLSPCAFPQEHPSKWHDVRTVSYEGLDLSTEAGARVAYRRIQVAAQGVCSHLHTLVLGEQRKAWEVCVRDATARAVADIGAPGLTAYAATKLGAPIKTAEMAASK